MVFLPSSHITIHGSMLTTINEKILADLELTHYQQKSMRMYLPLVKSTPQVTKKINMHLSELIKMAKEQLEV